MPKPIDDFSDLGVIIDEPNQDFSDLGVVIDEPEKENIFSQPDIEKRSGMEILETNSAIPNSNTFLNLAEKISKPDLNDFLTPMNALSMPEVIGATVETPLIKSLLEGSRREEALNANILRKANEKGDLGSLGTLTPSGIVASAITKGSVLDLLKAGGKALTGQELSTYGNFLEDIGAEDFSAATGGLLLSMLDPVNMALGQSTKALKVGGKVKKVDSFVNRPKGIKGVASELISKSTGIKRESVETVMTEGARKVLSGDYDENVFRNISNRITRGINRVKDNAGKEVNRIKEQLRLGDKTIDSSRLKMQLSQEMEKFGFNKERKFLDISGLGDDAKDLQTTMNKILGEDLNVNKLMDYREELGNIAFNGFTRGGQKQIVKATDKAKGVIRAWRHHITRQLHDIAPELAEADKNFVGATKLREKAAKFFDTVETGERFLRNLDNEGVTVSDKKLLRQVVRRITGSDEWVQRIRHNLARKGFQDLFPTSMGSKIFGGIAGASVVPSSFVNPLAGLGLASFALATSPKAVSAFLKSGEAGADLIESLIRTGSAASARKIMAELRPINENEQIEKM